MFRFPRPALMLAMLPLLLTGCAAPSMRPVSPSAEVPLSVRVPPLPLSAQQPQRSQTWSSSASSDIERWRQRLMQATPPASSASGPMAPPPLLLPQKR